MTETNLPPELPLLIEAIHDYAIILIGTDGIVRSWHSGAVRTIGYEAGEIVGSHFSRFYEADAIAAGQPQADLGRAAREGRAEDEGWRVRKNGARFWASTIITPVRDPSGKVSGFASVTRDRTQRREA